MLPLFIVLFLAGGLYFVLSHVLNGPSKDLGHTRRVLIKEEDAERLFESMGLELTPNPTDSNTLRGTRLDGLLSVELDVPSLSELTLDSSVAVALDVSDSILGDVSLVKTNWSKHHSELSLGRRHLNAFAEAAGEALTLSGDDKAVLLALASGFPEAVLRIQLHCAYTNLYIRLEAKKLMMIFDASILSSKSSIRQTLEYTLDELEELHQTLSAPTDHAANLVSMLRRHSRKAMTLRVHKGDTMFSRIAWDTAELLCNEYRGDDAVEELDSMLDAIEPLTQAACIRWGGHEGGAFERPPAQRVAALHCVCEDSSVGKDVQRHLTRELAWHALLDEDLPAFIRMDAAPHAYTSPDAPSSSRERDEALAELFSSKRSSKALAFAIVFDHLIARGWKPSPEGALLLATNGHHTIQSKMLNFIQKQRSKRDYASALSHLARAGFTDASKLVESLKSSDVGGRLSLSSDDAFKGALSNAGERGALSDTTTD